MKNNSQASSGHRTCTSLCLQLRRGKWGACSQRSCVGQASPPSATRAAPPVPLRAVRGSATRACFSPQHMPCVSTPYAGMLPPAQPWPRSKSPPPPLQLVGGCPLCPHSRPPCLLRLAPATAANLRARAAGHRACTPHSDLQGRGAQKVLERCWGINAQIPFPGASEMNIQ